MEIRVLDAGTRGFEFAGDVHDEAQVVGNQRLSRAGDFPLDVLEHLRFLLARQGAAAVWPGR